MADNLSASIDRPVDPVNHVELVTNATVFASPFFSSPGRRVADSNGCLCPQ